MKQLMDQSYALIITTQSREKVHSQNNISGVAAAIVVKIHSKVPCHNTI